MSAEQLKTCKQCRVEKQLSDFHKDKMLKYGVRNICKVCVKHYQQEHRSANPEQYSQRRKLAHLKERDAALERMKAYRGKNAKIIAEMKRRWFEENRDRELAKKQKYYADNVKRLREYYRKWSSEDRGRMIRALHSKNRKQHIKLATPKWFSEADIEVLMRLISEAGSEFHIDHIIPLKGKNVCGLHCKENWQLLPKIENMRKSNKFRVEDIV